MLLHASLASLNPLMYDDSASGLEIRPDKRLSGSYGSTLSIFSYISICTWVNGNYVCGIVFCSFLHYVFFIQANVMSLEWDHHPSHISHVTTLAEETACCQSGQNLVSVLRRVAKEQDSRQDPEELPT